MNSFSILKVFAVSLLVTVLVGPVAQRLLPGWEAMAADVGSGGAWFASIMYHIVYGIIIGAGAALAGYLASRSRKPLSLSSSAIAAAITVLLFDIGFLLLAPAVGHFAYLALLLMLLSLLLQWIVARIRPAGSESTAS
ncbi:MAG: hypothetical protein OQL28_10370 [Sedimenticola sp.]|nr:hypothetical protein [Sedimenticola sp.]